MVHLPKIRGRERSRGQSVVEFALVLPILLLLLGATIDFGRLFYAYIAVQNAAKEGALYGARAPLCEDSTNPACTDPNNVAWHVTNEASNLTDSNGVSLLSSTVACRDTAGALVQPINDCVDGYTYQVTVTTPFQLITPLLSTVMGSSFTLTASSQSTVLSDAFDPTGLEALVWVDKTGANNAASIASACTQADPVSSAGYYYQPCQDNTNVDNYLQFQENTTVNYKVRIRNTGNILLTGLTYAFTIDGVTVAAPGNCSTLPTSLAKAAAPAFCSFSRSATSTNPGAAISDDTVAIAAAGSASGLPTGATNGGATIKVVPAPHLAINLLASPYRLGGIGYGLNGVANYSTGALTLARSTSGSSLTEIQFPTGWFDLTVVNQGGAASNFSVSVTQAGSPISLPASCSVPTTLAASGQSGDTFSCIFPRTFNATQTYAMVATATATNAVIVSGQQPSVNVTTATCSGGKMVVPNLVDTLSPSANGSNKTVAQARSAWQHDFTGTFTTSPAAAADTLSVIAQGLTAYTCQSATTPVTVSAQ